MCVLLAPPLNGPLYLGQVTGPSTTFSIVMQWFLIQIAYNIGNVVKTNQVLRTNVRTPPLNGPRFIGSIGRSYLGRAV